MPHTEHKCTCGKKFTMFRYYKAHILKVKCASTDPEMRLKQVHPSPNHATPTSQNQNMNLDNNNTLYTEMAENHNGQTSQESNTYNSRPKNANSKTACNYCDKLYSKHNIKTHKSKCKYRYKDCHEYKLLVRAGITAIPETYIEVQELFCKLNETTPQLFTNLPPSITQVEDIESELPRNGRPRKATQHAQYQDNVANPIPQSQPQVIKQQINNNNNTNNITNNNTNNNTNNITNNNITNNNQQINIFLNPVCQESVAHITPERQMYIILQRLHAYKAFLDSVYETPANHNICISDRKGEQVKYLDAEHGINNGSSNNIIGDIAMAHLGQIDNFIETHKHNIPEHRKNDLKFLETLLLNENNNPAVIKQLYDKVAIVSGSSKILLDKYQKQKAIEYINGLPEPETSE